VIYGSHDQLAYFLLRRKTLGDKKCKREWGILAGRKIMCCYHLEFEGNDLLITLTVLRFDFYNEIKRKEMKYLNNVVM
jgi:hypothetical protein